MKKYFRSEATTWVQAALEDALHLVDVRYGAYEGYEWRVLEAMLSYLKEKESLLEEVQEGEEEVEEEDDMLFQFAQNEMAMKKIHG